MNKKELVAEMAQKSGLAMKDADKALSAFIEVVSESLQKSESVQLVGFAPLK